MAADAPRVALRTLGCKVNRTESEALAEALSGTCAVMMDAADGADVVVVNTCTVTGEADAKARKAVRHALGTGAAVVVTGCLAAVDPHGLEALGPRVIVEPDRLTLPSTVARVAGVTLAAGKTKSARPVPRGRTRVMVKVQDGCDHRCSYCIVPDARGLPRSVPAAEVVERVEMLAAAGVPEVVLTGVNLGKYHDPRGVPDIGTLLRAVMATSVTRVRISSIEPLDLDARLLEALASTTKLVPHLHVPLQSGCDRTLGEMGRGYTSADYCCVLDRARAALPGLSVTADVIAGFPGETDSDFAESLAFVERVGFTRMHVFRYSPRAGTPAASRADQVPPAVKAARALALRDASDRSCHEHAKGQVGSTVTACVERVTGGRARGTADDSLAFETDAGTLHSGDVVRLRIEAADSRGYRATVLESL